MRKIASSPEPPKETPTPTSREGVCCHNANKEHGLTSVEFDEASDARRVPVRRLAFLPIRRCQPARSPSRLPAAQGTYSDAFGTSAKSPRT